MNVYSSHPRMIREVCWKRGDVDTSMLNVDDNAHTNSVKSGYGVLVRNHDLAF